jgi:hypothetical protein
MQHISTPTQLRCQQNASIIAGHNRIFYKNPQNIASRLIFFLISATRVAIFD